MKNKKGAEHLRGPVRGETRCKVLGAAVKRGGKGKKEMRNDSLFSLGKGESKFRKVGKPYIREGKKDGFRRRGERTGLGNTVDDRGVVDS